MHRLLLTLLTLSIVCLSTPVFAQSGDKDRAVELANEGGAAFQNGDFAGAAQKFAEAYDVYNDPNLKLNEMAAWYKARRCGEALDVASLVSQWGDDLSDTDKEDLEKVQRECGYNEAKKLLDAGDLDGAEAQIRDVTPLDPQLASDIGELRGKIAERRRTLAEQQNGEPDETPEDVTPPSPPPAWMRPAGLGAMGGGAGLVIIGLLKFALIDQPAVKRWQTYFQDTYGCELRDDNTLAADECAPRNEARSDYDTFLGDLRVAQRSNAIIYVSGGIVALGGAGLFGYYMLKQSQYEKYQSENEAVLAPVVAPNYAGFTFQLSF